MKTHKDLDVWKLGIQLAKSIYLFCHSLPSEEKFGLISQMKRSSTSISSNIAEGAARGSNKEYIRYLYYSLASLSELETQIILCQELGISEATDTLEEEVEKLRRKLLNFIRHRKSLS